MTYPADSKTGLLVLASSMIAVATLSITLRFWSRIVIQKAKFGLDDWLALASLPFGLFVQAAGIYLCHHGLGKHVSELSQAQIGDLVRMVYGINPLFDVGITLYRLSTLCFYVRIFGFRQHHDSWAGRFWQMSFMFVLVITLAFPFVRVPVFVNICHPVQSDAEVRGNCSWSYRSQVAGAAFSFGSDMLILILPMPMLFRLHMHMSRRISFAIILAIGYSIPFMSFSRLMTMIREHERLLTDISYAAFPLAFWFSAESAMGIFIVSIPAMFQLLMRGWQFGIASLFTSRDFSNVHLDQCTATASDQSLQYQQLRRFEPRRSDGESLAYIYACGATATSDGRAHIEEGPANQSRAMTTEHARGVIHIKRNIQISFEGQEY